MAKIELSLLFTVFTATFIVLGHSAGDTLGGNESIRNGQTMLSSGAIYELGFFSPPGSSYQYIGMWYSKVPDRIPVWIANRDKPLNDTTGELNLTSDGNLVLFDSIGRAVWSTGTSNLRTPMLQLEDSGNLILIDASSSITMWQSFDHPSDTFLLEMKLGVNFKTNSITNITSWKSGADPFPGDYIYGMETNGVPQIFIWKGSTIIFRTGPWDGQQFSGSPEMRKNGKFSFEFVWNTSEVYYAVQSLDNSAPPSRALINSTGYFERWVWSNNSNSWNIFWSVPADPCDYYAYCGANNICTKTYAVAICQCAQGFVPISQSNNSDGCTRRTTLNCSLDKFWMLQNVKLPDTVNATANRNINDLDQCKNLCLNNCNCTAYAINGENGCVTWFGDLMDIRTFSPSGDVLYIRLAASEFGSENVKSTKHVLIVAIPVILGFVLLAFLSLTLWCRRRRNHVGYARSKKESTTGQYSNWSAINTEQSQKSFGLESDIAPVPIDLLRVLPSFDLDTIRSATEGFSPTKQLGKGGFGIVYKGQLQDGQEIAVKKLSGCSFQHPDEFRNELLLIANLQHRNLVRLLGCCIEGDEQILIIEFMQNGSLDTFIYDKTRCNLLNWRKRLDIIMGIARGLLYLHQDSNMKVIHCDLKPSNILLDQDLNPKISDFGISRMFVGDERHKYYTKRLAGTFGYMAPEYATDGLLSLKSDVFSFGVLVLEILSGQKNSLFSDEATNTDLLDYAYRLWKEGRSLEILDNRIDGSYPVTEILRCIKVGLLCVQDQSEDRPTMGQVILMLSSEDPMLTVPKRPAAGATSLTEDLSSNNAISATISGQ